jgi:hypothetical protein
LYSCWDVGAPIAISADFVLFWDVGASIDISAVFVLLLGRRSTHCYFCRFCAFVGT